MEYIIVWLGLGIASGIIGSRKGIGCLGFFLGCVLGPIGLIIILVMKGNRKQCAYCKEYIHKDATICPKCQKPQGGG